MSCFDCHKLPYFLSALESGLFPTSHGLIGNVVLWPGTTALIFFHGSNVDFFIFDGL
jgi:hypothetical protein